MGRLACEEYNIHNTILEAITDFRSKTGEEATTIYLGYDEYRMLSQWVDKQYGAPLNAARVKVWGCQVFYVPTKSHLAVSGCKETI